jgi:hypothetical protein
MASARRGAKRLPSAREWHRSDTRGVPQGAVACLLMPDQAPKPGIERMPATACLARVGPMGRASIRRDKLPEGVPSWFRLPSLTGPAWCPGMTTYAVSAPTPGSDRAWGRDEVAHYLRICVRQLTDLRREDPSFPSPRMIGRRPLWAPGDVSAWLSCPAPQVAAVTTRRRTARVN